MEFVNIQQAKTHLSRYAKRVKEGETIILCDRNRPFAEIRPFSADASRRPRVKLGVLKGSLSIPDDFNDPLPEFESDFYGTSE